ncbi:hypothetical protein FKG94_05240 [Exilibacterium tricleocarpae]|uniref:Lysine-N-methylase n=1 Tax=Exilibacterium tricleocarpae TaxID=2591008 RepID=A0A545U3M1_9GAMM|nr:flagellin lysine-N-methylase [Exilibacterium tricleocarpae]TQV84072.1 hypothetical protein FKG94_05240 [Exilibacterium tricleocarpae]
MQTMEDKHYNYAAQFQCIADRCEDSCCNGWDICVDEATHEKYREHAPKLLDYVEIKTDGPAMRQVEGTKTCGQLREGLCRIHSDYGESYLPDTCSMYPKRAVRIGESLLVGATSSCPEIARLILSVDSPFTLVEKSLLRRPSVIPGWITGSEMENYAMSIMARFMEETQRSDISAEQALVQVIHVCTMLDREHKDNWAQQIGRFFLQAENIENRRLKSAGNTNKALLPSGQIMQTMYLLGNFKSVRSLQFLASLQKAFVKDDEREDSPYILRPGLLEAFDSNIEAQDVIDETLKRYLGAEIIRRVFPFGNERGNKKQTVYEKVVPLAVYFCFLKIALLAHIDKEGNPPELEKRATILQILSKALNHLPCDVAGFLKGKGLSDSNLLQVMIYKTA